MPPLDDERWRQVGERLQQAREEAGMTQEQAAAWIGLKQPYLSAMENGARKVDAIELFWPASLYGKPMEWFFNE